MKSKERNTPTLAHITEGANSWEEVYSRLKEHNKHKIDNRAGYLFEEFAKYFFLVEPSLKNDYKNVWLYKDIPSSVSRKLKLPLKDHGVDLVLETREAEYFAVQCKFRNNQNRRLSWNKDSIANLFAHKDKFSAWMVFTNAPAVDKFSETQHSFKFIGYNDLSRLEKLVIENIHLLAKGDLPKHRTPLKPRPHQKKAIRKVVSGFKKESRGQLILPCGAGKTLTSLWIRQAIKAKRTLVVVPSLALLRQTKDEWRCNENEALPYLSVCSEKDINTSRHDNPKVQECEIHGEVSTNSDEIRSFVDRNSQYTIYATYQSLPRIAEAFSQTSYKFDLVIADEAHKTASSRKSTFSVVHDNQAIPSHKRLYMTATPRIFRMKAYKGDVECIADMQNEKIFGKEFFRMSFAEAISEGILCDYKIVAIGVYDKSVQDYVRQRYYIDTDKRTSFDEANAYGLEYAMDKHDIKYAITYHGTVEKAKNFSEDFKGKFSAIRASHVNGKMSTATRQKIISEVFCSSESTPKSILTNARCLTEGVDVPAVDAVFFADPKKSKVDIVQAAGRALRKKEGKQCAYILVPVYHSPRDSVEEEISESPFRDLVDVINALKDHDERLDEIIQKIQTRAGIPANQKKIFGDGYGESYIVPIDFGSPELHGAFFTQGLNQIRPSYLTHEDAKKIVHPLGLRNQIEWNACCRSGKLPGNVPKKPERVYKCNGWKGWGDWLGTGNVSSHNREYLPLKKSRKYARSLGLKNHKEWEKHAKSGKLPENIPAAPSHVYKDKGWISWGDFLGTGSIANRLKEYHSYEEAKQYARPLGFKSRSEWRVHAKSGKLPGNIPTAPEIVYKDKGWISWGDFLGTNFIATRNREYLPLKKSRKYARSLKLKKVSEWRAIKPEELPKGVPKKPEIVYKDKGWKGFPDWLGYK